MKSFMVSSTFLSLFLMSSGLQTHHLELRKIPCKTPKNAASCYWTHGRLRIGNGTPAVRLWKIGTHRILGIYSGPSTYHPSAADPDHGDNEHPELPAEARLGLWAKGEEYSGGGTIFGDFEVCPLEPEKPGVMQAACIESAKNTIGGEQ